MRNELSEYMKVHSIFFSLYMFDRRNSFRPNNALGRVGLYSGGLVVIEHAIWMLLCLFYFIEFFHIFLDFF